MGGSWRLWAVVRLCLPVILVSLASSVVFCGQRVSIMAAVANCMGRTAAEAARFLSYRGGLGDGAEGVGGGGTHLGTDRAVGLCQ